MKKYSISYERVSGMFRDFDRYYIIIYVGNRAFKGEYGYSTWDSASRAAKRMGFTEYLP